MKNPQCHHAALQSLFFFVSLSLYFSLIFFTILSYFIGLCIWNCYFRKSTLSYLSETLYLSNRSLRWTISKIWERRNSSISEFWWAISSISGLLLLLPLNPWANFFALCGNLIQIHPSKMPEKRFLHWFWGLSKWQEKTPKRQKTSISFSFGALPPMIEGWQTGEPYESEYFLIYGYFFRIFSQLFTYASYLSLRIYSYNAYILLYSKFSILILNSHISQYYSQIIHCFQYVVWSRRSSTKSCILSGPLG